MEFKYTLSINRLLEEDEELGLSECSRLDEHTFTNSPSHFADSSDRATPPSEISSSALVLDLPTKVCTFHLNGLNGIGQGCLRVNCTYFHGTESELLKLRQSAAKEIENGHCCNSEHVAKRTKRVLVDSDLGNKLGIVCLAYLNGTCRRPGCRFLHLLPNIRPLPIAVCDRNKRGVCTQAERCRFFHGSQEDLTKMHAQGVTMYNPFTGEPHDPTASVEELLKLQTETTVPPQEVPPPQAPFNCPPYGLCQPPPVMQAMQHHPFAVAAPGTMPLLPQVHYVPYLPTNVPCAYPSFFVPVGGGLPHFGMRPFDLPLNIQTSIPPRAMQQSIPYLPVSPSVAFAGGVQRMHNSSAAVHKARSQQ